MFARRYCMSLIRARPLVGNIKANAASWRHPGTRLLSQTAYTLRAADENITHKEVDEKVEKSKTDLESSIESLGAEVKSGFDAIDLMFDSLTAEVKNGNKAIDLEISAVHVILTST
jgi:hypothetical protein